jgi:hypothetical protein
VEIKMSLLDCYVANTGEIIPGPVHSTQRIVPPARRPDASEEPPTERISFAVLSDSGELPIAFIETPRPRPETTARIVTSAAAKPDPAPDEPRPWFYQGAHRWTRSRALLTAATWPGGVR